MTNPSNDVNSISIKPVSELTEQEKIFHEIVREVSIDYYMAVCNQTDKLMREKCEKFNLAELMTVHLNSMIALSIQHLTHLIRIFGVSDPAGLMAIYVRSVTDGIANSLESLRKGRH